MKVTDKLEDDIWDSPFSMDLYGDAITEIKDIRNNKFLRVCCTQLLISPKEQKRILNDWLNAIPFLSIDFLMFSCHVPQSLINAIGQNHLIKGLYIKWTKAKSIKPITTIHNLEHLYIGQASSLLDINEIIILQNLKSLHIESTSHTSNYNFLRLLVNLEVLEIEGGFSKLLKLDSIDSFIGSLKCLKSLSLVAVKCPLPDINEILKLKKLVNLCMVEEYCSKELQIIRRNLTNLKYDQEYYSALRLRNLQKTN